MNVDRSNFSRIYPEMEAQIKKCDLIAFDLEYSGIKLSEQNKYNLFDTMEDRYQQIKSCSKSLTTFQLRIVLFIRIVNDKSIPFNTSPKFITKTYNLKIFPTRSDSFDTNFTCSAGALQFLRTNRMNINDIIDKGIGFLNEEEFDKLLYSYSIDQKKYEIDETSEKYKFCMEMFGVSKIWKLIARLKKPVVGHNCLFDLVTIYQKFFANLPEKFDDFRFEMNKALPTIYDTKFIFGQMRINFKELAEIEGGLQTIFNALSNINLNSKDEAVVVANDSEDEACYDSFMTGCCLLFLVNMLYRHDHSNIHEGLLKPYKNFVNVIKSSVTICPEKAPLKEINVEMDVKETQDLMIKKEYTFSYETIDQSNTLSNKENMISNHANASSLAAGAPSVHSSKKTVCPAVGATNSTINEPANQNRPAKARKRSRRQRMRCSDGEMPPKRL